MPYIAVTKIAITPIPWVMNRCFRRHRTNSSSRNAPDRIFRAVRTDGGGQYVVRDLAPGRYRLTVVAGSLSNEQVVEIPERTSVNVNVTPE